MPDETDLGTTPDPQESPKDFNVDWLTLSAEGPMFTEARPLNALACRKIVLRDEDGHVLDHVVEFNLFTGRAIRLQKTDEGFERQVIRVSNVEIDIPRHSFATTL